MEYVPTYKHVQDVGSALLCYYYSYYVFDCFYRRSCWQELTSRKLLVMDEGERGQRQVELENIALQLRRASRPAVLDKEVL